MMAGWNVEVWERAGKMSALGSSYKEIIGAFVAIWEERKYAVDERWTDFFFKCFEKMT